MILQSSPASSRRRGAAALALALTLPVAVPLSPARGQQGEPPAAAAAPAPARPGRREAPKNVNSLRDILDQLDWDPEQRGPLLIVAPEKTTRFRPKPSFRGGSLLYEPPVEVKAPGPRGYNLRTIDEVFDRKVATAGGLTVLAPRTMAVFDLKFPPPSAYAGMQRSEKIALLQGSLTAEQWRKLTSDSGLGAGDLSDEQRELMRAAFPAPLAVSKSVRTAGPEGGGPRYTSETIPLNEGQMQGARLSVRRRMQVMLRMEGERYSYYSVDNETSWGGASGAVLSIQSPENYYIEGKSELFGFEVKKEVPSHAKPGDLNFEASVLSRAVALEGAATVGDLVKRAAEVSGLELFADPRYAGMKVHLRGQAARAGDVLKALSLAVTGTWRKVEDGSGAKAWVMTDDLQGLGVRHALIRNWGRANAALQAERQKKVYDAVKAVNPAQMLTYRADDPFQPDDNLRKAIGAHQERLNRPPDPKVRSYGNDELRLPLAQLPEAVKQAAQRVAQEHQRQGSQKPLDLNTARVDMTASLYLEVPGVGTIPLGSGGGIPGRYSLMRDDTAYYQQYQRAMRADLPKPPVALGTGMTSGERAFLMSPGGPDEAAYLAKAAAGRGFDRFWIDVPAATSAEEFSRIADAVRASAPGSQVFAVVRLLRAAGPAATVTEPAAAPQAEGGEGAAALPAAGSGPADVNLFGEPFTALVRRRKNEPAVVEPNSFGADFWGAQVQRRQERSARLGDYLRPDRPENVAAIKARLRAISRVPGLAGIVARDLLPPGYERTAGRNGDYFTVTNTDEDFGYTPEMRLAFLRRHGADPIDLAAGGENNLWSFQRYSGGGMSVDLRLPFFRDEGQSAPWEVASAPKPGQPLRPLPAWNAFRREVAEAMLDEVFQAVRAEPGGDRLRLLRERAGFTAFQGNAGYEEWERGVGVKLASGVPGAPGGPAASPRKGIYSVEVRETLLGAPGQEDLKPVERLGYSLASLLRYNQPNNQGIVLDVSGVDAAEVPTLLTAIKPGVPGGGAAAAAPRKSRPAAAGIGTKAARP